MRKITKHPQANAASTPRMQINPAKKQFLHVLHHVEQKSGVPKQFSPELWQEVRVAKQKLSGIAANRFSAVWMPAGVLEHCYFHEVPPMLQACCRILREGGTLLLTVFDIQKVAEFVAKGNLEGLLYTTPAGVQVTALDVLYGYRGELQSGTLTASPNTAFTARTLAHKLQAAGFGQIQVKREGIILWAAAHKLKQAANTTDAKMEIIEEDINKIIRIRDDLERAPEMWNVSLPR